MSIRMPGPIVGTIVSVRRYWPLAPLGRARLIGVDQGRQVVDQLLGLEAHLAERDVDDAALVDLELDAAGLDFLDARSRSKVIVPDLGFGMRPLRPRMRPSRPTLPITSGAARATSKSVQPASIFLTRSSAPTSSAPARSASGPSRPGRRRGRGPSCRCRGAARPCRGPSGRRGAGRRRGGGGPRRSRRSRRSWSCGPARRPRRARRAWSRSTSLAASWYFLPCSAISISFWRPAGLPVRPPPCRGVSAAILADSCCPRQSRSAPSRPHCLADDLDAHAAGGAFDLGHGAVDRVALRSGILIVAISRIWSRVTLPTVSRLRWRCPWRCRRPCAAGRWPAAS